jgi:hypothetical protein
MLGRWLRKVDCVGVSSVNDVVVVIALIFGHGDGDEQVVRRSWC